MTIQTRGIMGDPQTFKQVLTNLQTTHEKFERTTFFRSKSLDEAPLKDFINLIEEKYKNKEAISFFELYQAGLATSMKEFLDLNEDLPEINPETIKKIHQDIEHERTFRENFDDPTQQQEFNNLQIKPSDLGLTKDQADKLEQQYGIAEADQKGLSLDDAYKLQEKLELSKQFETLGLGTKSKELLKEIKLLQFDQEDISLKTLEQELGINTINITDNQAKKLLGIQTGVDKDKPLSIEAIENLKQLAENHLEVSELGLSSDFPQKLNTQLREINNFTKRNQAPLTKIWINQQGIPPQNVEFLHQQASLYQELKENDEIDFEKGLADLKTMLKKPDQYQEILADYNITSPHAALSLLSTLDQFETVKNDLDRRDPSEVADLIDKTQPGSQAAQEGLDPEQMKELDISVSLNDTAIQWRDANRSAINAGVKDIDGHVFNQELLEQVHADRGRIEELYPSPTPAPNPTLTPPTNSTPDQLASAYTFAKKGLGIYTLPVKRRHLLTKRAVIKANNANQRIQGKVQEAQHTVQQLLASGLISPEAANQHLLIRQQEAANHELPEMVKNREKMVGKVSRGVEKNILAGMGQLTHDQQQAFLLELADKLPEDQKKGGPLKRLSDRSVKRKYKKGSAQHTAATLLNGVSAENMQEAAKSMDDIRKQQQAQQARAMP